MRESKRNRATSAILAFADDGKRGAILKALNDSLFVGLAAMLLLGGGRAALAQQSGDSPPYPLIPPQAQAVAPPAGQPPSAAPTSQGDSTADLAKKLSNPVANLISVPLQSNFDWGGGVQKKGFQYTLNVQPVIPFKLTDDWNLITRTIIPFTDVVNIVPGNPVGVGDIVQSFFLSPSQPINGIILGAGPVFLYPSATRDEISANQFGMGPTIVALTQSKGYTVGILANHIWGIGPPGSNGLGGGSILADDGSTIPVPPGRSPVVNATFLNPFASYTFPTQTTVNLSSESTYNWTAKTWTLPIVGGVSQLLKVGDQPISLGASAKYYVILPTGAPAWGARLVLTFLFPK